MTTDERLRAKLAAIAAARAEALAYAGRWESVPTSQVRAWFDRIERAGSRPPLWLVK